MSYRGQLSARGFPESQGLYNSRNEHDACGIGFVANLKGVKSHKIVQQGLTILRNIVHRGAVGADPKAGDGAGILIQMQMSSYGLNVMIWVSICRKLESMLSERFFYPRMSTLAIGVRKFLERYVTAEGQKLLGWRDVPVNNSGLGVSVKPTEPRIRHIFIESGKEHKNTGCIRTQTFRYSKTG